MIFGNSLGVGVGKRGGKNGPQAFGLHTWRDGGSFHFSIFGGVGVGVSHFPYAPSVDCSG